MEKPRFTRDAFEACTRNQCYVFYPRQAPWPTRSVSTLNRRKAFTLIELLACPPKPLGRRRSRSAFTLIELLAVPGVARRRPPGPSRAKRSMSAFTLIELLVVIAIIGVLISLLVPSLGRAREAAERVNCGSQMRQVQTMLFALAADNRGSFYTSFAWSDGTPGAVWSNNPRRTYGQMRDAFWWNRQLVAGGYVDNPGGRELLRCPYFPPFAHQEGITADGDTFNLNDWQYHTYGCRSPQRLSPWSPPSWDAISSRWVKEIRLSAIREPSTYWLLGDTGFPTTRVPLAQSFLLDVNEDGIHRFTYSRIHLRHGERANLSFADGSVSHHGIDSLTELGFQGGRIGSNPDRVDFRLINP